MKALLLSIALIAALLSTADAALGHHEPSSLTSGSSHGDVDEKSAQHSNASAGASSHDKILQSGPTVAPLSITSISTDPPIVSVGDTIL